ncbi:MAG: ATP-binding cassette domain-containing protein [Peptostreptococcaceae bacterium]
MILIENIEKEIKHQNPLKISNLKFEQGHIYSVLGHNGSGKSTLVKILYHLEQFDMGRISVNNEGFNEEVVYEYFAYNPQKSNFLLGTLNDNFNYLYKYSKNKKLLSKDKLNELIKEFGLENKLNTNIKKLSGGEQAKAQFIRTLIMNKDYNLFDEPMANMDFSTIKKAEVKLLELKQNGKTVILITHDFIQAKRVSDYIVFMENLNYIDTYTCKEFFDTYAF